MNYAHFTCSSCGKATRSDDEHTCSPQVALGEAQKVLADAASLPGNPVLAVSRTTLFVLLAQLSRCSADLAAAREDRRAAWIDGACWGTENADAKLADIEAECDRTAAGVMR